MVEDFLPGDFGQRGAERIFKKPLDIDEVFLAVQKYCALESKSPESDTTRQLS